MLCTTEQEPHLAAKASPSIPTQRSNLISIGALTYMEAIAAEGDSPISPTTLGKTSDSDVKALVSLLTTPERPRRSIPQKFRKTQIFVISDTHNHNFKIPKEHYDLVVCLGDHTCRSSKHEFEEFIREILRIDTDHIFIIFGNHEFSTDPCLAISKYPKFSGARLKAGERYLTREYALQLCSEHGVVLLSQGQYLYHLNNGTTASIYASPYTPQRKQSAYNGYRYKRRNATNKDSGHIFNIAAGTDLVLTHGPPEGILDDYGTTPSLRGCIDLLEAVALSRPRLHCFGHNHAGWGAILVDWDEGSGDDQLLKDAELLEDEIAQKCGETVQLSKATKFQLTKSEDLATFKKDKNWHPTRYCRLSHCANDQHPIVKGCKTLFVNAAYESRVTNSEGEKETNEPMIVELDLPLTTGVGAAAKEDGAQAPMRIPPLSQGTLDPVRELDSGKPGSWIPPHKRHDSTGQKHSSSQQATRVSETSNGRPVSRPSSEETPAAQGVDNGSVKQLFYKRPVPLGPAKAQDQLTLPLRGKADSSRKDSPPARSSGPMVSPKTDSKSRSGSGSKRPKKASHRGVYGFSSNNKHKDGELRWSKK